MLSCIVWSSEEFSLVTEPLKGSLKQEVELDLVPKEGVKRTRRGDSWEQEECKEKHRQVIAFEEYRVV